MATGRTSEQRPIHLHFESTKKVFVEAEDEDRFLMTARDAARACKQFEDEKGWEDQFNRFLVRLREWCEEHADRVETACVAIGDGGLNIFIITNSPDYDFDFDDIVTELDLALAKEFTWYAAEIMQLPRTAKEGELSLQKVLVVYGDGSRAS